MYLTSTLTASQENNDKIAQNFHIDQVIEEKQEQLPDQNKNFIKDIELNESTENLDNINIADIDDIVIPEEKELKKFSIKEIFALIKLQASKVSIATYAGITVGLVALGSGCAYLILRKKHK
jgi:hypothetical protein